MFNNYQEWKKSVVLHFDLINYQQNKLMDSRNEFKKIMDTWFGKIGVELENYWWYSDFWLVMGSVNGPKK